MDNWFLIKKQEMQNGQKKASSTNGATQTGCQNIKEWKLIHICHPVQIHKSEWIKDFKRKLDLLNLLKEKAGNGLELFGTGDNFINRM